VRIAPWELETHTLTNSVKSARKPQLGLEPRTPSFEGWYSIQLSYSGYIRKKRTTGGTWTHDIPLRRRTLYPTELQRLKLPWPGIEPGSGAWQAPVLNHYTITDSVRGPSIDLGIRESQSLVMPFHYPRNKVSPRIELGTWWLLIIHNYHCAMRPKYPIILGYKWPIGDLNAWPKDLESYALPLRQSAFIFLSFNIFVVISIYCIKRKVSQIDWFSINV
jgi:hypothetical protein